MSKMREAFEKWSTDDNPEHWNQRRGFEAGYRAAIAAVKEGGAVAWQSMSSGWIYEPEPNGIPSVPLYKLPEEDTP